MPLLRMAEGSPHIFGVTGTQSDASGTATESGRFGGQAGRGQQPGGVFVDGKPMDGVSPIERVATG